MLLKAGRIITVASILPTLAFGAPSSVPLGSEETEACIIPKVIAGKDTVVDMPYIGKQFCGMVMINNMYVLIETIADKIETEETRCSPAGLCTKKVRYIFNDHARTGAASHTFIFKGPKEKPAKAKIAQKD